MNILYRTDNTSYINMEAMRTAYNLSRKQVQQAIKQGTISELELIVPDTYDPLLHKLDINNGKEINGRFELELVNDLTKVLITKHQVRKGAKLIEDDPFVEMYTFLANLVEPHWTVQDGMYLPPTTAEMVLIGMKIIDELVVDLRNKVTKFVSIEEQLLYTSYGEASLRIVNGVAYPMDEPLFEEEAIIRGMDTDKLIDKVHTKYIAYVRANRTISAHMRGGRDKMRFSATPSLVFNELRKTRIKLNNLYLTFSKGK